MRNGSASASRKSSQKRRTPAVRGPGSEPMRGSYGCTAAGGTSTVTASICSFVVARWMSLRSRRKFFAATLSFPTAPIAMSRALEVER